VFAYLKIKGKEAFLIFSSKRSNGGQREGCALKGVPLNAEAGGSELAIAYLPGAARTVTSPQCTALKAGAAPHSKFHLTLTSSGMSGTTTTLFYLTTHEIFFDLLNLFSYCF